MPVVTFLGFAPPPRFDPAPMPFTEVRIHEAEAEAGPWSLISVISLADLPPGLDPNPADPLLRNLTTGAASIETATAWYRLDWRDAGGATFTGEPFQYVEPKPLFMSAAEVRAESQSSFARYPEPDDPATLDPLERAIRAAQGYVELMTGRKLDATLPAEYVDIAREALVMRVEQQVGQRGRKVVASQDGTLGLKSMRAGDYSETRFDPGDARKARLINVWPALAELLWLLATPERRLELLGDLSDFPAPAGITAPMGGYCDPIGNYWP